MTIGNMTEIAIPYAMNFYRSHTVKTYAMEQKKSKVLRPEQEFQMTQYDSIRAALIDYADVAISFGYIGTELLSRVLILYLISLYTWCLCASELYLIL